MLYEFFLFEIKYRIRRPETYLFFLLLFLFSLVGVEFVFQGVDLGLVKKNSPLVIAKTMAAITGFSMIIASMILGVPVLRDFQYEVSSLIYVNPITKKDYLLGRFLGSWVALVFIFSGVLWGLMIGEFMPWNDPGEFLPFHPFHYLQPFLWVVLPTLFFGAAVFFTTGALCKNLMVVYTQGVVIFVLFMITKGITNETFKALLDPFSLTTLTNAYKDWTVSERNSQLVPMNGIMLANKLFWMGLGISVLVIGYFKFSLRVVNEKSFYKKQQVEKSSSPGSYSRILPDVSPFYGFKGQCAQLLHTTWFHSLSILKLISFWAIILCCFIIILINSVNLGTTYGVDSYPTTYLIFEELREMSIYFLMIILIFYSGEIMWKEKDVKLDLIHDASPVSNFLDVSSRFLALLLIYTLVLLSLILAGILFQTINGYYRYELDVYFFGFFLELFPFLALYTFAALFFQALTGNKFLGMLATIAFAIVIEAIGLFGLEHPLLNFGGHALASYSDMNGYGHFLKAYLWVKSYWMLVGLILLILASIWKVKGIETGLSHRWRMGLKQVEMPILGMGVLCFGLLLGVGGYIFYNTNILNEFWTKSKQSSFRAEYEKSLKQFEYVPQPKIIAVNLKVDLYPSPRAYEVEGQYLLVNSSLEPIAEIHLQKRIESHVELKGVSFDRKANPIHKYEKFQYTIYSLSPALAPGDTLKMKFKQTQWPRGFEADNSETDVVYNGTFFDNSQLPGFGYQKKYELQDEEDRKDHGLAPRKQKAKRDDALELVNARPGSDSEGIRLDMLISTETPQTALSSGDLVDSWTADGRNYFHYKTNQQIINFYPIVSGQFEVLKDSIIPAGNSSEELVALEVYYHKGHEYNLARMMESMKMSLDYFSTHFSPYPYAHLRIVEFPRYRSFAQSLPGIIPFSEALGFIMDIDEEKEVDMAFYVTAHEVAHQWWGLQLEAANVQGQNMILETLAQYSALMVFKKQFGEEKVQQFLKLQREKYDEANLKSSKEEVPLTLVENEEYLYYYKGAILMYEFQKLIGEDKVNLALARFLKDWHSFENPQKPNRYASTEDLLQYFGDVSPESLKNEIRDMFEKVNVLN